jgi:hypothetical protein
MRFGLKIGFSDHFNTQLVTTPNYSVIADLHNLQITAAHAKNFQSAVFTSSCLVTASNSGDSSASAPTPWPVGHSRTTELNSKLVPLITPWHGPRRKQFPTVALLLHVDCCCSHVIAIQSVHWRAGCCLTTAVVSLFVSRYLPSNWFLRNNINWRYLKRGCWGEHLDQRDMKW